MHIDRIEQRIVEITLRHHFETSFGREFTMPKIILTIYADGLVGYGESPLERLPLYSSETVETAWHVQRDALIPRLLGTDIAHAADFPTAMSAFRGHNMAKAGLEAALWDIEAQQAGVSISKLLGGAYQQVDVGVSIGIQDSLVNLLARIESFIGDGYRRIKLKIKPGWDYDVLKAVREQFPDVLLMVDANSAYTLDDAPLLWSLKEFDLLMLEQPLAHDDLLEHAVLQHETHMHICLDESITTVRRAQEALELGSCRVINIKPARVSGISMAKAIHDLCAENDVPVWCGGLLESGIGRAHNLAVASLPNFKLPGDISASARYWEQDIVEPEFVLNDDGTISVPDQPGLGVEVIPERLERVTMRKETYSA